MTSQSSNNILKIFVWLERFGSRKMNNFCTRVGSQRIAISSMLSKFAWRSCMSIEENLLSTNHIRTCALRHCAHCFYSILPISTSIKKLWGILQKIPTFFLSLKMLKESWASIGKKYSQQPTGSTLTQETGVWEGLFKTPSLMEWQLTCCTEVSKSLEN